MLTENAVVLRSRFAATWGDLLYRVGSGLHFHAHYHAGYPVLADEQLAAALGAAWRLLEWEQDEGPDIGDHFSRLVARLTADQAAVRLAALDFARTPNAATRAGLMEEARRQFPTKEVRFYFNASPFADDSECAAWAAGLLPVAD